MKGRFKSVMCRERWTGWSTWLAQAVSSLQRCCVDLGWLFVWLGCSCQDAFSLHAWCCAGTGNSVFRWVGCHAGATHLSSLARRSSLVLRAGFYHYPFFFFSIYIPVYTSSKCPRPCKRNSPLPFSGSEGCLQSPKAYEGWHRSLPWKQLRGSWSWGSPLPPRCAVASQAIGQRSGAEEVQCAGGQQNPPVPTQWRARSKTATK